MAGNNPFVKRERVRVRWALYVARGTWVQSNYARDAIWNTRKGTHDFFYRVSCKFQARDAGAIKSEREGKREREKARALIKYANVKRNNGKCTVKGLTLISRTN